MPEAAGPAMAEMQPQRPAERVRGRLGEWMHRTFTVEGRAEVMAQKYAERVLAQIPEVDRAKAMDMLEQRRPELVEAYRGQAKGSLVRDAVIAGVSVAALGGGAFALSRNERVRGAVTRMGQRVAESGVGKAIGGIAGKGKDKATDVVNWILRRKPRDYGTKMAAGVADGLIHAYQGFPKKPDSTDSLEEVIKVGKAINRH